MKRSLIEDNKQAAWRVYLGCGGSIVRTARLLKIQGIELSEDAIARWAVKENWQQRMIQADMVALGSSMPLSDELIKAGVSERLASWHTYFATNPGDVDPMATGAYVALVKLALKLLPVAMGKASCVSPEEARRRADEILREDYGIERYGPR